MMQRKIMLSIILVCLIGAGIADAVIISGGTTPKEVTLDLGATTKDTLANLSTTTSYECSKTETICTIYEPYPPIICALYDENGTTCLEWTQPKECIDFDTKLGTCNKWDYTPTCIATKENCIEYTTIVSSIGITTPTIKPLGCTTKECCYDITDKSGYYNRLDTCLPNQNDKNANEIAILAFVENDLKQIANQNTIDTTTKTEVTPDEIKVNIQ